MKSSLYDSINAGPNDKVWSKQILSKVVYWSLLTSLYNNIKQAIHIWNRQILRQSSLLFGSLFIQMNNSIRFHLLVTTCLTNSDILHVFHTYKGRSLTYVPTSNRRESYRSKNFFVCVYISAIIGIILKTIKIWRKKQYFIISCYTNVWWSPGKRYSHSKIE